MSRLHNLNHLKNTPSTSTRLPVLIPTPTNTMALRQIPFLLRQLHPPRRPLPLYMSRHIYLTPSHTLHRIDWIPAYYAILYHECVIHSRSLREGFQLEHPSDERPHVRHVGNDHGGGGFACVPVEIHQGADRGEEVCNFV